MISELAITEVLSAVAHRRREGKLTAHLALQIRDAVLADVDSSFFHRLDMSPMVHRETERLLFHMQSVPLRTLDALHIAVAVLGSATHRGGGGFSDGCKWISAGAIWRPEGRDS